jgi:hypothetical protein
MSTASNEAILKAGAPRLSSRSTAVSSKGLEKRVTPRWRARSKIAACHSNGVWASS